MGAVPVQRILNRGNFNAEIKERMALGLDQIRNISDLSNSNFFFCLPNSKDSDIVRYSQKIRQFGGRVSALLEGPCLTVVLPSNITEYKTSDLMKNLGMLMPADLLRDKPLQFSQN